MRTLIYCRVSLDPRGEGRSVAEQEAEARSWATREQWEVVRVIAETGSASRYARSTGARARWNEVVDEIRSGRYDIFLTWEASRATRDLKAYAALRDVCAEAGVQWGYSGKLYDLSERGDRFRTGLDALLSEDESARISERVSRSVRARALAGAPHGKIPYGYRREYDPATGALLRQVPDEEKAPVVREVFARLAARESLHAIAVDFTARGIAPPRPARTPRAAEGQAWLASSVRRIATNPTHAGHRVHRGEVVATAAWPAIVDQKTFDTVQAILTEPGRITRLGDSRVRHLLSGIALCGKCHQGPMRVLNNRGKKSYTCLWCFGITRVSEPVDQHVTDRVVALLGLVGAQPDPDAVSAQTAALEQELTALQQRLDAFTDQAADGSVSPKALARIEGRLLPQIRKLERDVRASRVPDALADVDLADPRSWWDAATIEQRRDLLRRAFRVTIMPAGRGMRTWNPDLVQVLPVW